jgi:hypothetical protein
MTNAGRNSKNMRVQVIDVFHQGISDIDGSKEKTPRMGFFLGDEDEDVFLEVEDRAVTLRLPNTNAQKADNLEEKDVAAKRPVARVPPEYDLGDTLDVCQRLSNDVDSENEFDYPASLTQGPSQNDKISIQNLVNQRRAQGSLTDAGDMFVAPQADSSGMHGERERDTPPVSKGSIFTTGSGAKISISREKIEAAARMLGVSNSDRDGTSPCHGRSPDGKATDLPPVSGGGIFTTGSGTKINIPQEKIDAASRMLSADTRQRSAAGASPSALPGAQPNEAIGSSRSSTIFSTGTGSKISVSRESIHAAARILDGDRTKGTEKSAVTPVMSRFAPKRPGKIFHQPNVGAFASETPGQPLMKRHRPLSGLQTPRLNTPQNTMGGVGKGANNLITPGSESSPHHLRHQDHGRSRFGGALPVAPALAAYFVFTGMYGPGDVRAHLLSTGADAEVVSDAWVRNHYKWIVWKLALLELHSEVLGKAEPGLHLNYDAVKNEMLTRYNKEHVEGKRSFVKGILQRDIPMGTPCVLKVSETRTASTCTLELTDGWYSMFADCDKEITRLVQSGAIYTGMKLRIFGAELTNGQPVHPLESQHETRFILSYNQVHPVCYTTKLGAFPSRLPISRLSIIKEEGGKTPRTVVKVLRLFPPMVWSKLPSGVSTFQTVDRAGKAESVLEDELEQIYSQVKNDIDREELEMCRSWLEQGRTGGLKQVERLYASFVVSGDDQYAETLNTQDRTGLTEYVQERRAEMEEKRQHKVREVLGSEVPAAAGARTLPCRTLLIGEVAIKPIKWKPMEYELDPRSMALLTVWNCEGLQEGDMVSVSSIEPFDRHISSQALQGAFLGKLRHFQTTKSSQIDVLIPDLVPQAHAVSAALDPKQRMLSTAALLRDQQSHLQLPNLFDIDAVVLRAGPVYLDQGQCHHYQWVFAVDHCDSDDQPWLLAIQLCGPQDAIKWFNSQSSGNAFHFANVSVKLFDHHNKILQLQGSMATETAGADPQARLEELSKSKTLMDKLRSRVDGLL